MPIHDWTRVSAGTFHDFHHEWISTIKHTLNRGVLPPGYYAMADQVTGGLHPDVVTLERGRPVSPEQGGNGAGAEGAGGIALAVAPPRVRFTATAEPDAYTKKRSRIAIRHKSDHAVVAIVEIVSPENKASRHALRSFVDKTIELLEAGVHLLILDLFPPGPRDPQGIHKAIWDELLEDDFRLPPDKPLTLVAYSAGLPKSAYIEPVAVGDELPEMPLFLEPRRYVSVPLEPAYRAAFEEVPEYWREELERPGSA